MKRLMLPIIVVALLAIAGGYWAWTHIISPPPYLELEPLNYTEDSSWSALPVESPPAVWADGWGIDVFVISEDAALKGRTQPQLEKNERKAREQAQALKSRLEQIGEVYAPLYRDNARNDDITRAFETYLRSDNLGRALIIVQDSPVPPSILARLEQDPDLRDRFGGFLAISDAKDGIPPLQSSQNTSGDPSGDTESENTFCPERLKDEQNCQIVVPAHKSKGIWIITSETIPGGTPIEEFPEWLEANVAKSAEPLGDFEEVEIVDIRRPGETDERRDRETDN